MGFLSLTKFSQACLNPTTDKALQHQAREDMNVAVKWITQKWWTPKEMTAPQATSKLVSQTRVAGGKEPQIPCTANRVFKLHQLLQNAGASQTGRSLSRLIVFCIETNLGWLPSWPNLEQEAVSETSCGLFQPKLFYDFMKCQFLINSCLAFLA